MQQINDAHWHKEWLALRRAETAHLAARQKNQRGLILRLAQTLPEGVRKRLHSAFFKGFQLVLAQGTRIEKKSARRRLLRGHALEASRAGYHARLIPLKALQQRLQGAHRTNLIISSVEGAALGVLGIGLPDLILFLGMLLKSLYETAAAYGYGHEGPDEERFMLALIEGAMAQGAAAAAADARINRWLREGIDVAEPRDVQVRRSADALADALLITKCIQGLPVVGVAGGLFNPLFLEKINAYARLKYRRRLLLDQLQANASRDPQGPLAE